MAWCTLGVCMVKIAMISNIELPLSMSLGRTVRMSILIAPLLLVPTSSAPARYTSPVGSGSGSEDPTLSEKISISDWAFSVGCIVICLAFLGFGYRTKKHWHSSVFGLICSVISNMVIMADKSKTTMIFYRYVVLKALGLLSADRTIVFWLSFCSSTYTTIFSACGA